MKLENNDISKLPQKELVARFKKLQALSESDKEMIDILRAKNVKLENEVNVKNKDAESIQRNYEGLSNMTVFYIGKYKEILIEKYKITA